MPPWFWDVFELAHKHSAAGSRPGWSEQRNIKQQRQKLSGKVNQCPYSKYSRLVTLFNEVEVSKVSKGK